MHDIDLGKYINILTLAGVGGVITLLSDPGGPVGLDAFKHLTKYCLNHSTIESSFNSLTIAQWAL